MFSTNMGKDKHVKKEAKPSSNAPVSNTVEQLPVSGDAFVENSFSSVTLGLETIDTVTKSVETPDSRQGAASHLGSLNQSAFAPRISHAQQASHHGSSNLMDRSSVYPGNYSGAGAPVATGYNGAGAQYSNQPWNVSFPFPMFPMQNQSIHPDPSARLDRMEKLLEKVILDKSSRKSSEDIVPNGSYDDVSSDDNVSKGLSNANDNSLSDGELVADEMDFDQAFCADTEVGSPIDEKLAKLFSNACSQPPASKYLDTVRSGLKRPSNLDFVVVPNAEKKVYEHCTKMVKDKERGLIRAQEALVQSIWGFSQVANDLNGMRKDNPQCEFTSGLFKAVKDATFLAAHASYHISMCRRANYRMAFDDRHEKICSSDIPVSKDLFGVDLVKSCKDISDLSSAMEKVLRRQRQVTRFSRPVPVVRSRTRPAYKSSFKANWQGNSAYFSNRGSGSRRVPFSSATRGQKSEQFKSIN